VVAAGLLFVAIALMAASLPALAVGSLIMMMGGGALLSALLIHRRLSRRAGPPTQSPGR
jgi:hypothetical protein